MFTQLLREPGQTFAISDTGPIVSVFQSESLGLLRRLFGRILVPVACLSEIQKHGWEAELEAAMPFLSGVELEEAALVSEIAQAVANHPTTKDKNPAAHLGEAEAIALGLRPEHRDDVLLLDERAARDVALRRGLQLSGFPGVLLLAAQLSLLSPQEVKQRLQRCREQGTHYGVRFIEEVFEIAKTGVKR